jgi:hypothetical protein
LQVRGLYAIGVYGAHKGTVARDRSTVVADKQQTGTQQTGASRPGRSASAPVAGLLFDPALRPGTADLEVLSLKSAAFAITHRDDPAGHLELLRDGLMFDCQGLGRGAPLHLDSALQQVALPGDFVAGDLALLTFSPGAHLAGAGQLLPVVRILAELILALADLPGLRAVVWLPARLAMSPAWFVEAIGAWSRGGPFPALALAGLLRSESGFASRGLAFFTGQEFLLTGKDGVLREADARAAVRLADWLVSHGRVDSPCEVDLAGFGTVWIEPDRPDHLRVHSL